jgi:hypothetical protein
VDETTQSPPEPPRTRASRAALLAALVFGAVVGGMAMEYWLVTRGVPGAGAQVSGDVAAEVERLASLLPTQSHTMKDVGDQWANLWFAVEAGNWPLARFYFDQARQQLRWTVAIRPERVLPDGGTLDVKGMATAVDLSALATVQYAIEDQDREAFDESYRQALEACYTCHKAVGMPYLRPQVPTAEVPSVINLDPSAAWPE